jgi:hypothetical protein
MNVQQRVENFFPPRQRILRLLKRALVGYLASLLAS